MNREEDQPLDPEFEKLKNSKFKQQKLPAWRPVPTITSTTITFLFFGVVFIIIGAVVLHYSQQIVEIVTKYDDKCSQTVCNVTVNITSDMQAPIMIYYQLNNFYQNHRRYVKSKSNSQLHGDEFTVEALKSSGDCAPIFTMKDLGIYKTLSGDVIEKPEEFPANPCGLIAKSLFNDTYNLTTPDGKSVFINETNIAWEADKEMKYKRPIKSGDEKYHEKVLWTDTLNEHFMVWMRPAGLPNFRKLWGRINENLPKGIYTLTVNDNYPVHMFSGEKIFVMSTVNSFGGKNSFLGISYIVVGCVCLVMAIAFVVGYKMHNQKKDN